MGIMSEIDIEISNSKALSYLLHEIDLLKAKNRELEQKKG
jgi:hypothetical protein